MRAFILTAAAIALTAVFGCDTRNAQNYNNGNDLASAPESAPRVNLYPLTTPPPGSVQPLQGYAPTRISATQYGPEIYRDGAGNVELAERNPVMFPVGVFGGGNVNAPAAGAPVMSPDASAFAPAGMQVTEAGAGNDAQSTFAALTYPDAFGAGAYQTATYQTATYQTAEYAGGGAAQTAAAAYDPAADPNSPYYCPPGAAFCPVPGSLPGAPAVATSAASFGVAPAAPSVVTAPATMPATPVYQTAVYTPTAPQADYTPPAISVTPAPAGSFAPPATSYAPPPPPAYSAPVRLSATAAYAPPPPPPPMRAPAPFTSSAPYRNDTGIGVHFGEMEGTADIVGPVPSLDPVVRPATGGGYLAPAPFPPYAAPAYQAPVAPVTQYGAPSIQPLSANVVTELEQIQAMVPPAPASASVARAGRPAIGGRSASAPSAPVSAVAGMSAAAMNAGEYRLVPALDVPPGNHPNDFGPSQWFEVVRPGNGPVRIGRISATCVCVGARIPKRQYEAGERILVEARMISRPSVNNVTYGLYVNIVEPVETVVDADVTVRY